MDHPKSMRWVSDSNGNYPKFSIQAGVDSGNYLYVARANHQGAVVPGKLAASHKTAYIPYNMKEVPVSNYEVLVAPPAALSWVVGQGGNIPANAVLGGNDNGERLYIGRVIHNNTITVGKVHPSHGVCYFPYGGEEKNNSVYEILVVNAYGKLLGINPN